MSVSDEIRNLQNFAKEHRLTRNWIALKIKVTAPTMSKFFDDDWNPRRSTIEDIREAFIQHTVDMEKGL